MIRTKTVVFLHGAFVTYRCWDEWLSHFKAKGFTCIIPPWPLKNEPAQTLRARHPDASIGALTFGRIIDEYSDIIRQLPEKPILIGHSIGGLLVQVFLQRGLGEAGVAIHSAPPRGVLSTEFSLLKSSWKALLLTSQPYLMSFSDWQYAFTNGLPAEVQKTSYDELLVPESHRAMRGLFSTLARVDFSKPHAPLLFIAGSRDHFMPASLNRTNFKRYTEKVSVLDFKKFEGRTHFVLGRMDGKKLRNTPFSGSEPADFLPIRSTA